MLQRIALCIPLTLVLLAAPASALAADVVVPSSVAATTTLPAGGSRTLTLRCPDTAVALNAAVTNHEPGVTIRRSIPGTRPGTWSFRFRGASGGGGGVRAVLRCVRLVLPVGVSGARLDVSTRRPPVVVPAGGTTTVRLRCGAAWLGTGYGFDPGTGGDARLVSVVPRAHGWDFTIANSGSTPATARVTARCLRQMVTSTRGRLRFNVPRLVFSDLVGRMPGSAGTFTHSCGRSQFSLATGFAVDAVDGVQLRLTHPEGRRAGRFRFRRAASDDVVTTFLVCLSRRSQFR